MSFPSSVTVPDVGFNAPYRSSHRESCPFPETPATPIRDCGDYTYILLEDGTAQIVQKTLKDSVQVDTLRGTFVFADSIVKVSLSDNSIQWAFKRDRVGNLAFMKLGDVYRDADGMKAVLVRFYKKIK